MQKVLSGRRVMICREIPVIPSGVKTKGKTTMNIGKLMTATGQLVDDLENLLVDLECDIMSKEIALRLAQPEVVRGKAAK